MLLEYTIFVGGEPNVIRAKNFEQALKKLNKFLGTNLTEDQVRINSVIRIR